MWQEPIYGCLSHLVSWMMSAEHQYVKWTRTQKSFARCPCWCGVAKWIVWISFYILTFFLLTTICIYTAISWLLLGQDCHYWPVYSLFLQFVFVVSSCLKFTLKLADACGRLWLWYSFTDTALWPLPYSLPFP